MLVCWVSAMLCCETIATTLQTKDSVWRASYHRSKVGKGLTEHKLWSCSAVGSAVQSCSKSQQALTSQLLDLITNHRLSADSEHSSDMWCRCSTAASLVGWYVSSQLRSALSPELTVTSHRGSLGESPTVVTILILKVARNIARMGKTLIQG